MKHTLILLIIVSFTSQAQKKLLKQAFALESSEQYEQAAEKYKEVLYKNATRTDAISGLERTAQKVIDKKLSAYFISRNSGELEEAVNMFENVIQYQEELKYFNISAKIPAYYHTDYKADKQRLKTESEFKLTKEKKEDNESKYTEAVSLYNQYKWVLAWDIFSTISGYKESSAYLDKIKAKATRVSILENSKNRSSKGDVFRNSLLAEIIQLDNPLIRVISRDNLDQLIEEQKLGLTGLLNEQSVADLGEILGVEVMLLTRVLNYNMSDITNTRENKTAYVATSKQVYDPATQTTNYIKDYYPVTYQEYFIKNALEVSLQYQLIDVATAEVLSSDVIFENYENNISYAFYEGDHNTLHPSNGSAIYTKGKERKEFLKLFSQNPTTLTQKEMDSEVQKMLSKKVAKSLDNYFRK
ncbi:CsgG/HfaB family protein [Ekhidna sp.]